MTGSLAFADVPASLTLMVGGLVLPPGTPAAKLAAALEEANAAQRLDGLPDTLNPGVLDPVKVDAFMKLLLDKPDLTSGLGGSLALDGGGLGLGTAEPVTAAAIAHATRLAAGPTAGRAVLDVVPDCGLAAASAAAARQALSKAEHEVAGLGAPTDAAGLGALSLAKSKRAAIAQTWRLNANVVVTCRPGDAAAKADFEAARKAVSATLVAPHTGMPTPP